MRPVDTDVIRNVVCVVTPGSPAIRMNRSLAGLVGGQTRMDLLNHTVQRVQISSLDGKSFE